jgi:pyridoxamine 5'-phosphate oxidase
LPAPRITDLRALEAAIWRELAAVPGNKSHAWRTAVLATAEAGAGVDARTVILREVDAQARTLILYTDARSAKVRQIGAARRGVLVMWSAALSWQLRVVADLEAATSGLTVSSRWARLKMTPAAQDYLSPLPPGSALAGPDADANVPAHAPIHAPERSSREHFAVITARVLQIDWLELHAEGHRRAIFEVGPVPEAPRWVVP